MALQARSTVHDHTWTADSVHYTYKTYQTAYIVQHLRRHHQNSTETQQQKDTNCVIETTCGWPGSTYVHRWLVSKFSQWCDTLFYICTTKQTIWAICALTIVHADENKQENQARVTLPIAVNIPPRLPAAEDRVIVAKRVHLCPMNSKISIRSSQKSEVEGIGKGLTW